MDAPSKAQQRLLVLAWIVLIATVLVGIVSGDVVQATSSGAGCGESWPRCDGSFLPGLDDLETRVEFFHRAVSLLLGIATAALIVASWRVYGRHHRVFKAAAWAGAFLLVEALIGAALVQFGWVEDDASVGRVVADAAHVVNTFLLVAALTLTVFFAAGGGPLRRESPQRSRLFAGAGIVLVVAMSGAINSLADTLAVTESVDIDATPVAGVLVTVRGIHPVLAIVGGLAVVMIVRAADDGSTARSRNIVIGVVIAQLLVGIANIALLTPLETQLVHLVLADTLWIAYVWFAATLLSRPDGDDATRDVRAGTEAAP